eukprot:502254_1
MSEVNKGCSGTAVVLALCASLIWSIGNVLMKKGHNDANACTEDTRNASFFQHKTWLLGFFVYFIGSLVGGAALGHGSLSVVGTLESLTLVFSAIIACTFLNERILRKDLEGMVCIFLGCALVVCVGPSEPELDNTSDTFDNITTKFKGYYCKPSFILFMFVYTVLLMMFLAVMRYYEKLPANQQSMENEKTIVVGPNVLLLTYLILASYFYSWNLILQKSFFTITMIKVGDWHKNVLYDWFFYYGLVGTIVANFGLEFFKQRAMRFFGVVVVIPIYRVGGVVTSCMVAAMYFGEFGQLTSKNYQIGFALAIVMTMIGIMFLTSDDEKGPCRRLKQAQKEVRESVCDSVSLTVSIS